MKWRKRLAGACLVLGVLPISGMGYAIFRGVCAIVFLWVMAKDA